MPSLFLLTSSLKFISPYCSANITSHLYHERWIRLFTRDLMNISMLTWYDLGCWLGAKMYSICPLCCLMLNKVLKLNVSRHWASSLFVTSIGRETSLKQRSLPAFWKKIPNTQEIKENTFLTGQNVQFFEEVPFFQATYATHAAWKRGLPGKCALFVLFCPIKKAFSLISRVLGIQYWKKLGPAMHWRFGSKMIQRMMRFVRTCDKRTLKRE